MTWDVLVSGVNYRGEAHGYPYPILAAQRGDDMWGIDAFAELCRETKPDVVVVNNDWWNVARFLGHGVGVPIVGYMPVDGRNLSPRCMRRLSQLDAAVWYTEFGRREAEAAGYCGRSWVLPHGVNTRTYRPLPRHVARRRLNLPLPRGAFVVGNVNRNQPRKRLDLTLQYFAEWIREFRIDDAYLCFHCAPDDIGWDLRQLAEYFGIARRVLFSRGDLSEPFPRRRMRSVYNAFDVQVSTTMGEGWGLTHMEGMACGVPQIVPNWAALGEWPRHVEQIACDDLFVHPEVNTVGGIPSKRAFVAALQRLYENRDERQRLARQVRRHVGQPKFQWPVIADEFSRILESVLRRNANAGCAAAAEEGIHQLATAAE
jgi:glycosyltransferase involved in cell wall biosynthesis